MSKLARDDSNRHHVITVSSREHREQLITDLFNSYEMNEASEDVVVLKRREVTFREQKYQARLRRDRSWKNRLAVLFLWDFFGGAAPEEKPETTAREAAVMAALPTGTELIEIRLFHKGG